MGPNRIRERLDSVGKSQGWLSRVSGLDIHYVNRLVNGKIKTPSIQTALLVAHALNCLVEDLFFLEFDRIPAVPRVDSKGRLVR